LIFASTCTYKGYKCWKVYKEQRWIVVKWKTILGLLNISILLKRKRIPSCWRLMLEVIFYFLFTVVMKVGIDFLHGKSKSFYWSSRRIRTFSWWKSEFWRKNPSTHFAIRIISPFFLWLLLSSSYDTYYDTYLKHTFLCSDNFIAWVGVEPSENLMQCCQNKVFLQFNQTFLYGKKFKKESKSCPHQNNP
jgi:hypothetical protein